MAGRTSSARPLDRRCVRLRFFALKIARAPSVPNAVFGKQYVRRTRHPHGVVRRRFANATERFTSSSNGARKYPHYDFANTLPAPLPRGRLWPTEKFQVAGRPLKRQNEFSRLPPPSPIDLVNLYKKTFSTCTFIGTDAADGKARTHRDFKRAWHSKTSNARSLKADIPPPAPFGSRARPTRINDGGFAAFDLPFPFGRQSIPPREQMSRDFLRVY